MQTSENLNELASALAKAQGSFAPAMKDAENGAFKNGSKVSKYADIAAVWEAVRKPLSENGLAVMQQAARSENGVAITTQILHASGQWIRFDPLVIPMTKQDAHGVGSATTYGRRFSLCAALGIVADADDDGNAAAGRSSSNSNGNDDEVSGPAAVGTRQLSKPQARPEYDKLVKEIQACQTPDELAQWGSLNKPRLDAQPEDWQQSLRDIYSDHKTTLKQKAA